MDVKNDETRHIPTLQRQPLYSKRMSFRLGASAPKEVVYIKYMTELRVALAKTHKIHSRRVYQVIGLSRHSESLEELVLYQALYADYGLWEEITYNDKKVPRF